MSVVSTHPSFERWYFFTTNHEIL